MSALVYFCGEQSIWIPHKQIQIQNFFVSQIQRFTVCMTTLRGTGNDRKEVLLRDSKYPTGEKLVLSNGIKLVFR